MVKIKHLVGISAVSLLLWALLVVVGWWWTVMGTWALVVVCIFIWISLTVVREEDAESESAMPVHVVSDRIAIKGRTETVDVGYSAEQQALEREQFDFNARRDNAFLDRARKAESLGFIDPDDAA